MKHIYLHSIHEPEDAGIDFRVSSRFLKEVHKADSTVIVHLSTIGGSWEDGMQIFDAIDYCKQPVYIIGHGCVCSMGTIIMQAADRRYLMPHASFMVHYGEVFVGGHQKIVESTNDYYKVAREQMISIYAERCNAAKYFSEYTKQETGDFIRDKLDKIGDWYMGGRDAVRYGFIDKVISKQSYRKYLECQHTT